MIICGAKVFTDKLTFEEENIVIEGERILDVSNDIKDDSDIVDATGKFVIPGLVDIHFHGAMGHDFSDASLTGLKEIAQYEAANGILAMCPATMTVPEEKLHEIMKVAKAYRGTGGADLVGINLEGPFISENKAGAQNSANIINPDEELFAALCSESGNLIKIVDIAPEKEGASRFIRRFSSQVKISVAHTEADYETTAKAFLAGASHVTHLFNAMNGIHHRFPGPVIAALEHHAEVEIIADAVHIHPAMVRFVFNHFDKNKVILISDSMRATGLPDGEYDLGGQPVSVVGNLATLSKNPATVAGSVTNLYDCMKKAISFGVAPEEAVAAATVNPAKSIGIDNDYGLISPGKYANLLIVDSNFNIQTIILRGKIKEK